MSLALRTAAILTPREPRNLLRFSEEFDNAAWVKTRSTVTANAGVAPNGQATADKLVEDGTATQTHSMAQSVTPPGAGLYNLSVYLKAGERTWVRLLLSSPAVNAYLNLATGALGTVAGSGWVVTDGGDGFWRLSIPVTLTGAATTITLRLATGDAGEVYSGDNASGAFVWGAQLTQGGGLQPYRRAV